MLGVAPPSAPGQSPLSPCTLRSLYTWLDGLPLSRPKRHLARDFSDGVMLAEIVKHFHPRLVDLHNYVPTCNTDQKLSNWSILNRKVFHKLHFCVSEVDIRKVVANTPGAIEPILCVLREKVVDAAVHEDPPRAAVLGTINPGVSQADADGLWVGLASTPDTGLLSPPVPSGVKTLQSEGVAEKMGHCGCRGQQPAGGLWEHSDPAVQQLLEEKEQALALLQETVKVLQMKVLRLEQLVELKDWRIRELTRPRDEPH
ncbi:sperm flagellar protein 1-like [Molossus nigricans]